MNCCWILLLLLFCGGSNRNNGCGSSNWNSGRGCGCSNNNRSNDECGCNDATPFPNFGGNASCGCDRD